EVHQLWTEPDTSPRRHAAVVAAVLELSPGRQPGQVVRPLVPVDPEQTFAELADQQVVDPVAVEVAYEGRGGADVGVDRLAGRLDPYRRRQLAGPGRRQPEEGQQQGSRHSSASLRRDESLTNCHTPNPNKVGVRDHGEFTGRGAPKGGGSSACT